MLYLIKNRDDLEKLEELASLQNQVEEIRLLDKSGKQNFYEIMKKLYEPLTDTIKDASRDIAKTMTEISIRKNKVVENLNDKLLEIVTDWGIIACFLLSLLSKTTNPEQTSQFKLVKDPGSNRVNDLLISKTMTFFLSHNLLTFRDLDKTFELQGDVLKMMTNKNYNVDLAILTDKKILYDFAKEMNFDIRTLGNKSMKDKTL